VEYPKEDGLHNHQYDDLQPDRETQVVNVIAKQITADDIAYQKCNERNQQI
jgi:hypothetical protein